MTRTFTDSLILAMLVDVDMQEMDIMPDDEVTQAACVRVKWSWEEDGSELERFVYIHKDGSVKWSTFNDYARSKPAPDWFLKQIEETADEFKG